MRSFTLEVPRRFVNYAQNRVFLRKYPMWGSICEISARISRECGLSWLIITAALLSVKGEYPDAALK